MVGGEARKRRATGGKESEGRPGGSSATARGGTRRKLGFRLRTSVASCGSWSTFTRGRQPRPGRHARVPGTQRQWGTPPEPQQGAPANQRGAGSAANGRRSPGPGPRPGLQRAALTLLAPAAGPGSRSAWGPGAPSFIAAREPGCTGCRARRGGQLPPRSARVISAWGGPQPRPARWRCQDRPETAGAGHTCWKAPVP